MKIIRLGVNKLAFVFPLKNIAGMLIFAAKIFRICIKQHLH